MNNRGINAIIVSLAFLTVVSLAGSSLGTLAWYAYNATATAAFSGTAIRRTEQLEIGLEWKYANEAAKTAYQTKYDAVFDTEGGKTYCFMPQGSGFSSSAIMDYLSYHGHATNMLIPVTTNVYDELDDVTLYESPTAGNPTVDNIAERGRYVSLPFAFRIHTTINNQDSLVSDQYIWLTDATAVATALDEEENVKDVTPAIRIHVAPDHITKRVGEEDKPLRYILHPTAEQAGSTAVAGALNLDYDGNYDYREVEDPSTHLKRREEIVYGVYTGTPTHAYNATRSGFDDLNGTGNTGEEPTTFYACHASDVYTLSDYSGITLGQAEYLSFDDVRPEETGGEYQGGYPIALTQGESHLATTTLTIYLEGWDHCVVDEVINAGFSLGLQFEINRV